MRNRKNGVLLIIPIVIVLLLCVSVGYAALQTTLTINGTAKINKTQWIIHFKNLQVTDGSYLNNGANSAVINSEDDTKVTYTITLKEPGDFYEFTVDAVNDGTISAKLDAIRETGLTSEEINSRKYVTYTVTGMPSVGSTLDVGEANKKTIKIRVEYPFDIQPEDLPTSDFTFTKTIELDYVQNRG